MSRRAVAAVVIGLVLVAVALLVARGGRDATVFPRGGDLPRVTPAPTPGDGGGPRGPPGPPLRQRAIERFQADLKARCENAGPVARISASPAGRDERQDDMADEIAYLEALLDELKGIKPPTDRLRGLLDRDRDRVRAQIRLDERIAGAGDDHSVRVGTDQNQLNRDARNAIVSEGEFDACLRALDPR